MIDDDVREEYWRKIRGEPEKLRRATANVSGSARAS
jgi:hypothetical protein